MSARIRTSMPLLDQECVLEALSILGEVYEMTGQDIILPAKSVSWAPAKLQKDSTGRYVLQGDSDYVGNTFQQKLISQYQKQYQEKLIKIEEEKIRKEQERLEAERKKYIESQKQKIYDRAKKMGYSIKESERNGNIKMVLVKRIY